MEDPVGVEVMDAVQDLVEERLDHSSGQLKRLLVGLGRSVELNNVLWENKKIIFSAVYMWVDIYGSFSLFLHSFKRLKSD